MRLLLDTHAFLWFIAGDAQLGGYAQQLIEDESSERFLSVASLWEMTIKASLGRLTIPEPSILVRDHVWANGIDLLPLLPQHFNQLMALPLHHKDPFDRLLIAQAQHEEMLVLTKDEAFSAYEVQMVWSA